MQKSGFELKLVNLDRLDRTVAPIAELLGSQFTVPSTIGPGSISYLHLSLRY